MDCATFYKPTVRQIKRLRRLAVGAGLLDVADAPGYLLECMVFNAPTSYFSHDDYNRVLQVLAWLNQHSPAELRTRIMACDRIITYLSTTPASTTSTRQAE